MKKFNLVLMSIFTLVISSVLAACNFKDVKVTFSQGQVAFDQTENVNLDDFLKVENADLADFQISLSNPAVFNLSGHTISAKSGMFGRGYAYATYRGNSLAQIEVVARKKFDIPKNIVWDDKGFVTWDTVSGIFEGESVPTSATQFLVQGERRTRLDEGLGEVAQSFPINQVVQTRSFALTEVGEYALQIKALGNGYFSESDFSQEQKFFVGYMPQLSKENFSFQDGVLSWTTDVLSQSTSFQVKFDGRLVADLQSENSFDLSSILDMDETSFGEHKASVVIFDTSNAEDKKLARESEPVTIVKLQPPDVEYVFDETTGGQLSISSKDQAEKFEIVLKSENDESGQNFTYSIENSGNVLTSFDASAGTQLPSGIYDLEISETSQNTDEKFFFRSKPKTLETKILKLETPTFEGATGNAVNGNVFHAKATRTAASVATKFEILGNSQIVEGFSANGNDNTQKSFEITLQDGGKNVFEFKLKQLPSQKENPVGQQKVFVLNGDASDSQEFVKMPQVSGQLTHSYKKSEKTDVSVLTFDKVSLESAKNVTYKLKVKTAGGFEEVSTDKIEETKEENGKISFILKGAAERLFEPVEGKYTFAVEVSTENAELTIASSKDWDFGVLSAPIAVTGSSTIWAEQSFEWQSAQDESPAQYRIEVFSLTKQLFEQNQNKQTSFDPEGQEGAACQEDIVQAETSHQFGEGYYFLKIFSLVGENDTSTLSSHEFLPVMLCVSKQLEIDSVKFGYDDSLKSRADGNSGYYVEIMTDDTNVRSFQISVDGNESITYTKGSGNAGDINKYALKEDFLDEKTYSIKVVAHWTDEHGQNDDLKYAVAEETFDVIRLAKVTTQDLQFDDRKFVLTVQNGEGTKQVEVKTAENPEIKTEYLEGLTKVELGDNTGFSLSFQRLSATENFEFDTTAEKRRVFLSSAVSEIAFERVTAPSDLEFSSGVLKFSHQDKDGEKIQYVLDVTFNGLSIEHNTARIWLCKDGNANAVKIEYEEDEGKKTLETTFDKNDGKDLFTKNGKNEIRIEDLLKSLSGTLGTRYNSATSVDFSLWADCCEREDASVKISSSLAKTAEEQTTLNVEKMHAVVLEFIEGDGSRSLRWNAVNADVAIQEQTKYEVHQLSSAGDKIVSTEANSALTYSLQNADFETQTGQMFTYTICATNPKFLSSAESNKIKIFKNPKISTILVGEDGTLTYMLSVGQECFSQVEVKVGESPIKNPKAKSSTGTIKISEAGKYSFQVKGIENGVQDEVNNAEIFYLDSEISSWTLATLDSIKKTPEVPNVTFDGNIISWEYPFNKENIGVEYMLFFKDSKNVFIYKTTAEENQSMKVDFKTNSRLREIAGKLAAEDVQVQVMAHLPKKWAEVGEEIYYEPEKQILDRDETRKEFNYFPLTEVVTLTKLSAPQIEKVEYTGFDTGNGKEADASEWGKRQNPTIKVTFSGNYGENAKFSVYVNDEETPLEGLECTKDAENGKYHFDLASDKYSSFAQNGQILKLRIIALDGGNGDAVGCLPSSETTLSISRAAQIEKVELLAAELLHIETEDEEFDLSQGISRTIQFSIDKRYADQFSGNKIILKVDCTKDGNGAQTKFFEFDIVVDADTGKILLGEADNKELSDFIDTSLSEGGKLVLSAYADNFASVEHNRYILACSVAQTSIEYQVLKSVQTANVQRTAAGFKITELDNSTDTVYVVEYKTTDDQTKTATISNATEYAFEIPLDWKAEESGKFTIYAVQDAENVVRSKMAEIDYVLKRLAKVGDVSLVRDAESQTQKLQWSKVENATKYLLRAYERTADNEKGELLCEKELENTADTISCTLADLFGENYSNLAGKDLTEDFPLIIEITALGDETHNNSEPKSISPTIKGNKVDVSNGDIYVKDGLAFFKAPTGNKYKYRFVYSNNKESLTEWTEIQGNYKLDVLSTKFDSLSNLRFDVEIFVVAEDSTSESSNFVFDSYVYSTQNLETFTFEKLAKIQSVSYENENIEITFAENEQEVSMAWVGIDENAITEGKAVLVELENKDAKTYSISLFKILDKLKEKKVDYANATKLYFWAHKESVDATKYVVSQVFKDFSFSVETEFAVKEVKRLHDIKPIQDGQMIEDGTLEDFVSGWTNTYLLFAEMDTSGSRTTEGIFVRITYHGTDENGEGVEYVFTEFVAKKDFDKTLKNDEIGINLNKIFDKATILVEGEEGQTQIYLSDLYGTFDIAVMWKGKKNNVDSVSPWVTVCGENNLTFQRLAPIRAIELREGNLYWMSAEDLVDEYYVYFFNVTAEGTEDGCRIVRPSKIKKEETGKLVPQSWLDASAFAMDKRSYHLAIQSVDYDDVFVLASKVTYKTENLDGSGEKSLVYKNQVNTEKSPLKLREDGVLTIEWAKDEGEEDLDNFFTVLNKQTSGDFNFQKQATLLATNVFTSPFTFTLKDLIDEQVKFRLRFKPVEEGQGAYRTFTVDSFVLLADLVEFYKTNHNSGNGSLEELLKNLSGLFGDDVKNTIESFRAKIMDKKCGIGTSTTFMDDYFEGLQAGRYTMEYCVLGNSHTLNSQWYGFKNSETENNNLFGVNAAPDVQIVKTAESEDNSHLTNSFKVKIKKSKIETKENSAIAEKYYVRVGSLSFVIDKLENTYELKLADEKALEGKAKERKVSVTQEGNGNDYLCFYLNMNNGDCLLNVFGDLLPQDNSEQAFEVCAVGNGTSMSSKSDLFRVTFLKFVDFAINDGQFQWCIPSNLVQTKIVVKQKDNSALYPKTAGQNQNTATFALEDDIFGEGMYDFVEFMLTVDTADMPQNVVFVDSDVYVVKNVYKLHAPTLSNDLGHIGVTTGNGNFNILDKIYSDRNAFTYQIENDASATAQVQNAKFSDERETKERSKQYLYTAGVTGLVREENENYYLYKSTEQQANHFDVKALGTTATLKPKADEGENGEKYNIKELRCEDHSTKKLVEFENENACVAVSSKKAGIDARMMESVTSMRLENGLLVWDAVTGRTGETLPESATVIYRLDFDRYTLAADGETKNFVPGTKTIYTDGTSFDMSALEKDEHDNENTMFKVTIRTLALEIKGDEQSSSSIVQLESGKKAGGNVKFGVDANGKEKYVLLSEGFVKDGIARLPSVVADSVKVENKKLTWKFSTNDANLTQENFGEYFEFIVMETGDGKEISQVQGTYNISLESENGAQKTFTITFTEEPGALSGGEHTITVYVNKPESREGDFVRSFGVSATITKLAKVEEGDFAIETNYENQLETLSLEKYFQKNGNNSHKVSAKFVVGEDTTEIELSSEKSKIYILRSNEQKEELQLNGNGYTEEHIVIGDNVEAHVTFVASGSEEQLSSDESDAFNLTRAGWAEDAKITWNGNKAEFSWNNQDENIREYVVEATYIYKLTGESEKTVKRIYHFSSTTFCPTIIGKVKIAVRAKLGDNALQSNELSEIVGEGVLSEDDGSFVNFNIFSSGMGTKDSPYVIDGSSEGEFPTSEQQFKNISCRQTKGEGYTSFVEIDEFGTSNETEENKFYFKLAADITLEEDVKGFLFSGTFDGEIDGENHKITYSSSATKVLSSNVQIEEADNAAEIMPGVRAITFTRGSALFETLGQSAAIENLKIEVEFAKEAKNGAKVPNNAIIAGLAIINNGNVKGVTIEKFTSSFVAQEAKTVMVYSGIVGRNSGNAATIEDCKIETSIELSDQGQAQFIFVSGIVYTNDATVKNCTSGQGISGQETPKQQIKVTCTNDSSFVQIAGIAITNTMSGGEKLTGCNNYYELYVEGPNNQGITCYMSGVVILGMNMESTKSQNHNHGKYTTVNVGKVLKPSTDDDVIATTTATGFKTEQTRA